MNQKKAEQVAGQVAAVASRESRGRGKTVDLAAVELAYRAGIKSLRQIADEHGVSHTAIMKRAKKYGWTRDLKARIRARSDALVSMSATTETSKSHEKSTEKENAERKVAGQVATKGGVPQVAEDRVVEMNAALQAEILLRHRANLALTEEVWRALMGELKAACHPVMQEALEAVLRDRAGQVSPKKAEALERAFDAAMELPARIQSIQRAIAALSTQIERQRESVGIGKDETPEDPIVAILKLLDGVDTKAYT